MIFYVWNILFKYHNYNTTIVIKKAFEISNQCLLEKKLFCDCWPCEFVRETFRLSRPASDDQTKQSLNEFSKICSECFGTVSFYCFSIFIWLKKIFCSLRQTKFLLMRRRGSFRIFLYRKNTIWNYLGAYQIFIVC